MKHPVTAGRSSKFDLGLLLVLLPHCTRFRTGATEYSECIDHAPDLAVDKTYMYEKKRHYSQAYTCTMEIVYKTMLSIMYFTA